MGGEAHRWLSNLCLVSGGRAPPDTGPRREQLRGTAQEPGAARSQGSVIPV